MELTSTQKDQKATAFKAYELGPLRSQGLVQKVCRGRGRGRGQIAQPLELQGRSCTCVEHVPGTTFRNPKPTPEVNTKAKFCIQTNGRLLKHQVQAARCGEGEAGSAASRVQTFGTVQLAIKRRAPHFSTLGLTRLQQPSWVLCLRVFHPLLL